MENTIAELQNSEVNIRLHLAKDRLYLDSEWFWWGGFWSALLIALGGLIIIINPILSQGWEQFIGIAGGFSALFFVDRFQKWAEKRRRWAAIVQEESDLNLFKVKNKMLDWNHSLIPEGFLNPDIVNRAAQRSKTDKKRFLDWYLSAKFSMPDEKQQILLCQRENLSYDYLLRSRFAQISFWTVVGIMLLTTVLCFWKNPPFREFLFQIILPLSGLLKFLWDNYQSNKTSAQDLEQMEADVRKKLKTIASESHKLTLDDLREIQDFIFRNRSTGLPIPGRFYIWLRPKMESTLSSSTESITQN